MKYIILLGDGMADENIAALGDKSPLAYARTDHMDRIAREGTLGLVDTIPTGFAPGSDVANMSVLGYDPTRDYSGRSPLEAASMGVSLEREDVAFRCNLVTLGGEADGAVMESYNAGHITTVESREILTGLAQELGSREFEFYPGVSYRHLLVWRQGLDAMQTTPPHDITGQSISTYLPRGPGADAISNLMARSRAFLRDHPVNRQRVAEGRKPANAIWLWGQGRAPRLLPLTERYALRGGMISAVDLLNGIGLYAGLEVIHVPGATGYIDTDYRGKARKALEALANMDFVFVHVEAPDEMGHEGNCAGKIKAIEDFDEKVVGEVLRGIDRLGPVRLMVLSDHPTPLRTRTHASEPSPFAVWSSVAHENARPGLPYSEAAARQGGLLVSPGYLLMDKFIRGTLRG